MSVGVLAKLQLHSPILREHFLTIPNHPVALLLKTSNILYQSPPHISNGFSALHVSVMLKCTQKSCMPSTAAEIIAINLALQFSSAVC